LLEKLQIERERQEEETRVKQESADQDRANKLQEIKERADRKTAELAAKAATLKLQHEEIQKEFNASNSQVVSIASLADAANRRNWTAFNKALDELDPTLQTVLAQRLARLVGGAASDWFLTAQAVNSTANRFRGVVDTKTVQAWKHGIELIANAKFMDGLKKFKEKAAHDPFAKAATHICRLQIADNAKREQLEKDLREITDLDQKETNRRPFQSPCLLEFN